MKRIEGGIVLKNFLDKWCQQVWLYFVYLLAIIMGNILMLKWDVWGVPQILSCLLAIMIPAHVFEENTFPGGFFFMNNLNFKSKEPMVYPQNRLTNMITNLGAEIIFIIMTLYAARIETAAVLVVIAFGIIELVNHTREGVHMYFRYRDKGKKTIYAPGMITSYLCLLPLSVKGISWMMTAEFSAADLFLGIGIVLFIAIGLILIPFAFSVKVKSSRFAFKDNGYFNKYE